MEAYWQNYGGLAQFGYPISSPLTESSPTESVVVGVFNFISSTETPKPCSLQPSCSHNVGERFGIVHEKMSACME